MRIHIHCAALTDRPTGGAALVCHRVCVCGAWPFWSGLTAGRKRWRRRAQPYVCGRARRSVCRVVSASSSVDGPGGLDRRDRNAPQEKNGREASAREGRRAHARVRREDREAGGVPRPSRPAAASQCRVPGQGARRARPRSCLAAPSSPAPPPPSPSPPPRTPTPRAVCGAARSRSAWRARAAELFRRGRRAVPLRTAAGSVRARARLALARFGPSPSPSHPRSASGHRGSSLLHAAAEDGALDRDVPMQPLAFASRTRGEGVSARQRHPKAVDAWHCHAPVDAPTSVPRRALCT